MAGRAPTDVDALNATFDRIEEGNERARKARTPTKSPAPKPAPAAAPTKPAADRSAAAAGSSSTTSATRTGGGLGRVFSTGGTAVESGAGFALGLLFWGWIALPFLKAGPSGGPKAVKNVLRAKFFNKGSDGAWLP